MPTAAPSIRLRRITFVTTELGVGGAERCLVNLACASKACHWQPDVVSIAAAPPDERAELCRILDDHAVPYRFLDAHGARHAWSAMRKLRHHFRNIEPHVVQSFLFHANVLTAAAISKRSTISRFLGIRVDDPRRWRSRLEISAARRAAGVIAVSRGVAESCLQRGFPKDRMITIPNGIDLDRIEQLRSQPVPHELARQHERIVFVGRLDRQKGVQYFADVIDPVLDLRPDARFTIVGDGPLRGEVIHWQQRSSHRDRIEMLGWQANPLPIVAAASLVLMPSLWEGMSNVLLEAMSVSRPVVTFDVQGTGDVLDGLDPRQVVPLGDTAMMSENVTKILAENRLGQDIGQANRARIEARFGLQAMTDRYLKLYESALARRHSTG